MSLSNISVTEAGFEVFSSRGTLHFTYVGNIALNHLAATPYVERGVYCIDCFLITFLSCIIYSIDEFCVYIYVDG